MEMHVSKAVEVLHKQFLDGLISLDEYIAELQLVANTLSSYGAMHSYLGRMNDKSRHALTGLDND